MFYCVNLAHSPTLGRLCWGMLRGREGKHFGKITLPTTHSTLIPQQIKPSGLFGVGGRSVHRGPPFTAGRWRETLVLVLQGNSERDYA